MGWFEFSLKPSKQYATLVGVVFLLCVISLAFLSIAIWLKFLASLGVAMLLIIHARKQFGVFQLLRYSQASGWQLVAGDVLQHINLLPHSFVSNSCMVLWCAPDNQRAFPLVLFADSLQGSKLAQLHGVIKLSQAESHHKKLIRALK